MDSGGGAAAGVRGETRTREGAHQIFLLHYYPTSKSTSKALDPSVLESLDVSAVRIQTFATPRDGCFALLSLGQRKRLDTLRRVLTGAAYNGLAYGGLRISGDAGLHIYTNNKAEDGKYEDYMKWIGKIKKNVISAGVCAGEWKADATASGADAAGLQQDAADQEQQRQWADDDAAQQQAMLEDPAAFGIGSSGGVDTESEEDAGQDDEGTTDRHPASEEAQPQNKRKQEQDQPRTTFLLRYSGPRLDKGHFEYFDLKKAEGCKEPGTTYELAVIITNKQVRASTLNAKFERFNKSRMYDQSKFIFRPFHGQTEGIMTLSRNNGQHIKHNDLYNYIRGFKERDDPSYYSVSRTDDEIKTQRLRQQLGIDMEKPFEDGEETRKRQAQEPAPPPVKKSRADVAQYVGNAKPRGRPAKNRTVHPSPPPSDRMMYTASILCSMGARGTLDSTPSVEAEEIQQEDPAPQAAEEEENPINFRQEPQPLPQQAMPQAAEDRTQKQVRGDLSALSFAEKIMESQRQDAEKHADVRVQLVEMTCKSKLEDSERRCLELERRLQEAEADKAKVIGKFTRKLQNSERLLQEADADKARVISKFTRKLQNSERRLQEADADKAKVLGELTQKLQDSESHRLNHGSSAGIALERLETARLREKARAVIGNLLKELETLKWEFNSELQDKEFMIRDLEERLLMLGRDMRSRGNELQDKECRIRDLEAIIVARDAKLARIKDKLSNTEEVLMFKTDQLKHNEERFSEMGHELAVSAARRADSEKALADLRKLLEERALKKIPVRKPKA